MNGNERRRMEFLYPENMPTSEELKNRRSIIKNIIKIVSGISFIFMVLGAYIVASVSVQYKGTIGFSIAFFGIILDVILGMLIAYHLGNKIQVWYTQNIIHKSGVII